MKNFVFLVLPVSLAGVVSSSADPGWTMEKFAGINGTQIDNLTSAPAFYTAPGATTITTPVLPANTGDNFGTRVRGYIIAPATGFYTFWESGDDAVTLFLSPDENPVNKQPIASHTGSTISQEWEKYPTQMSRRIPLQAGKKYYMELLHKEGVGSDHASVAWSFNAPQTGPWYLASTAATSSVVFSGIDLASVTSVVATMSGSWIGSPRATQTYFLTNTGAQATCQFQYFDGTYTKVAKILLSQNGANISGYQVYAKYRVGNWLGQNFDTMGTNVPIGSGGYGVDSITFAQGNTLLASKRALIPLTAMETYAPGVPTTPSGLLSEFYSGIPGNLIKNLTDSAAFDAFPASTTIQADGLSPVNAADSFGVRLRGFITPQTSGDYTFWESGDDEVQLFLSPTESAGDKQLIAFHTGYTGAQQWERKSTQKSRVLSLTAGKSYYIEVLHKEGTGADHAAIAWTPPGGTREIIPASVLNAYAACANDQDDDFIDDTYETAVGLNPADRADAAADGDGDGIPNLNEYRSFADPITLDEVPGALTDDIWFGVPGDKLNNSTYKAAAIRNPDYRAYVTTTRALDMGEEFVRRIRGYIVAPVSGTYQFWGTADDDVDFFLSASSSKFQLQQIIHNNVLGVGGSFDIDSSQKSLPVTLVAGQRYYFELWHKEGIAGASVALAWKTPGGSRELIPSRFLCSFVVDADDQDDDGLSDAYELANGLSIADSGRTLGSSDGFYGDLDGDGLTNGEEQKFNSKANLADSDGDGVSDYDEANFFGSAMLANAIGPFVPVATLPGDSYTAAFGEWGKSEGKAMQDCRRGSVTYPVIVPASGIHALKFRITSIADGAKSEQHEFDVKLNGKRIAYKVIDIAPDGSGTLAILSPWLAAGETYNLELFVDNSYNWRRVSIDNLQILVAGGTDSDNNGTPDWVDIREHNTNGFDSTAVLSKTSPATVEGNAKYFELIQSNGTPVTQAPNGRFFTEVSLTPGTQSTLDFTFENGAVAQTATVQWLPTNLLQETVITLRQNDSLLLTAFSDAENASLESYTLTVDGQTYTGTADQPSQVAFPTPGVSTLTLEHTGADAVVTTRSITVTVLPMVAIDSPLCVVGYPRLWTHPALPAGVSLLFDDKISRNQEAAANTYTIATTTPAGQPLLVKSFGGLILGCGCVDSFRLCGGDTTGSFILSSKDGYDTMQMSVVKSGNMKGAIVKCEIIIGGAIFEDGGTIRELCENDFGDFGTVMMRCIKTSTTHSNCHRYSVLHNGVKIAQFN